MDLPITSSNIGIYPDISDRLGRVLKTGSYEESWMQKGKKGSSALSRSPTAHKLWGWSTFSPETWYHLTTDYLITVFGEHGDVVSSGSVAMLYGLKSLPPTASGTTFIKSFNLGEFMKCTHMR